MICLFVCVKNMILNLYCYYMIVALYGGFSLVLVLILLLGNIVTWKLPVRAEKRAAFECGFDPSGHSRLRFCIKFFIVGVIFLVFDVEVALILALFYRWCVLFFLIILVLGLIYE